MSTVTLYAVVDKNDDLVSDMAGRPQVDDDRLRIAETLNWFAASMWAERDGPYRIVVFRATELTL